MTARAAPFEPWQAFPPYPPGDDTPDHWLFGADHELFGPYYDGSLHGTICARIRCDAGVEAEYRWSGGQFHVARLRQRSDDCCSNLDDVGPWPVHWPPADRCSYRWEVEETSVALVALAGATETRHVVELGAVASCDATDDGTILTCDGMHHPVTAANDDWVVWNAIDALDDTNEASARQHVPRGCAL